MSAEMDNLMRDMVNSRSKPPVSVEVHFPKVEEMEMCAREVLWKLDGDRELGWEPGSFNSALIDLLCIADVVNRRLLTIAYPAMGATVLAYKEHPDGIQILRNLAAGPQTPGD